MTDDPIRPVPMSWIVGHDGSDGAEHATAWTLVQARERVGEITLLRAWEIGSVEFSLTLPDVDQFAPTEAVGLAVDEAARAAPTGVTVVGRTVRGGASNALLDASEHADLLVLGSRGLGGFRRLLLGSVSSQCATHATTPTVVVPATSDLTPVGRVVVGIDGSERSAAALRWAADWADPDALIRVVGAWTPPFTGDIAVPQYIAEDLELARSRFTSVVDAVEADVDRKPFERHHLSGDPARTLLTEAAEADLLVVGQRGLSGFSAAVLGSVATHVVHHATMPVAVVPDPA